MLTAYQVKIELINKRVLTTIFAKDGEEAIAKAIGKGEDIFSNHFPLKVIEKHMKVTLTELSDNPIMEGVRELEKENYELGLKIVKLEKELEGWRGQQRIKKEGENNVKGD